MGNAVYMRMCMGDIRNIREYSIPYSFLVRACLEGENASFSRGTSTGLLFPAISDSRCVPKQFCTLTFCTHLD